MVGNYGSIRIEGEKAMALMDQTPIMDVSPWPTGHGFEGASIWWDGVSRRDEMQRLDNLMGVALLDEDVRHRLVKERDTSLLAAFGLSKETQKWLREVKAGTLAELAQAIVLHKRSESYAGL
jgi:hypothetical protein